MSTFDFKPATRQGLKPLCALYGTSNSGKTLSALLLARGFAGPDGKVIMGDTESGRGALYADLVPGGYLHCDIEPPFSPMQFIAFLDAAEAAGAGAVVIDSFSHEWEGEGGVLDLAGDNEAAGKKGQQVWKDPKMAHNRLLLRLMRSKAFVIVCLRAKYKSRQVQDGNRKTVVKDDFVTPIQSEEIIFEFTCHAEMQPNKPGSMRLTKWSVPDLGDCFPKDGELVTVQHGEAIARWASSGRTSSPQVQTSPAPTQDPLKAAKNALWAKFKFKFNNDVPAFEKHLITTEVLSADENLTALGIDRMSEVCAAMGVTL